MPNTSIEIPCQCDCGTELAVLKQGLLNGESSGCTRCRKTTPKAEHRLADDPLYSVWSGIKTRCFNRNDRSYFYYGARGISICEEWLTNFEAFRKWATEHGY